MINLIYLIRYDYDDLNLAQPCLRLIFRLAQQRFSPHISSPSIPLQFSSRSFSCSSIFFRCISIVLFLIHYKTFVL